MKRFVSSLALASAFRTDRLRPSPVGRGRGVRRQRDGDGRRGGAGRDPGAPRRRRHLAPRTPLIRSRAICLNRALVRHNPRLNRIDNGLLRRRGVWVQIQTGHRRPMTTIGCARANLHQARQRPHCRPFDLGGILLCGHDRGGPAPAPTTHQRAPIRDGGAVGWKGRSE
jgi:hypothetical protein